MTTPLTDKQIDRLIADYLAGSLREAHRAVFEHWLRASPKNPRRVARLSVTDYAIREVCQDTKADYLLDALNQIDDAAGPAELVTLHHIGPSWHRYRLPLALGSAIAAVLVIAVTLIITLPSNTSSEFVTTPTSPSEPGRHGPAQADQSVVATLTATHNAHWAEGALAPGSPLQAGDRLTLTAGFAEVTTHDGAVAILEAPATIELTDSDNTLRLHSGKLVGICETDSSKGFVVRTPHMDITDLGTRFGVDALAVDRTTVEVLQGEVELSLTMPATAQPQRQRLTSGQAMAAQAGSGWVPVEFDPNRFAIAPSLTSTKPEFVQGNAVWLGKVVGDLGQGKQKANALQVFLEQTGLLLQQDVPVDFNLNNEWNPVAGIGQHRVAAGERVDVYLLHFDLINGHEQPEEFVIDFGRPILGVIGSQDVLDSTDKVLGASSVDYPAFEKVQRRPEGGMRGLNTKEELLEESDFASVDASGTTLRLHLWGGSKVGLMDQVRVIVRAQQDIRQP